jgi:hypothetical protein
MNTFETLPPIDLVGGIQNPCFEPLPSIDLFLDTQDTSSGKPTAIQSHVVVDAVLVDDGQPSITGNAIDAFVVEGTLNEPFVAEGNPIPRDKKRVREEEVRIHSPSHIIHGCPYTTNKQPPPTESR